MDRHGFVEEESENRSRSIGRRNLRAKLREQLKGYSNVRGFPLDKEEGKAHGVDRTESLTARRDSIRRRGSSVTRQGPGYESDAEEFKYRPKARKAQQESLLVPRLLWISVYLALCYSVYKGIQYFTSDPQVSLCETCPKNKCGVLDEEFIFPLDNVPEVPFGTSFPKNSKLQCRTDMCVPSEIADPKNFCRVVNDVAFLYKTRRLLTITGTPEEKSARFAEYFKRRSLQEDNGLAQSPEQPIPKPTQGGETPKSSPDKQPDQQQARQTDQPQATQQAQPQPTQSATPQSTPPSQSTPTVTPTTTPTTTPQAKSPTPQLGPAPAPAPSSSQSASLANGGFYIDYSKPIIDFRTLPDSAWAGAGNCSTLIFAPFEGDGYANLTSDYYKIYTNVSNYQQCCGVCYNDPSCRGWVRVAGGDSSVENCFLISDLSLGRVDPMKYNWQPSNVRPPYDPNLQVRYTGSVPIMFESGSFRSDMPELLNGCPYPPASDGSCPVPDGCNCGGGKCYQPGCISPQSRTRLDPIYAPYRSGKQG